MATKNVAHQSVTWQRTVYPVHDASQCIQPNYDEGSGYFRHWIDKDQTIALVEGETGRMYEIWRRNLEFLGTEE